MYLKVSVVLFYLGSFIIILYPSAFAFLVLAPIVHFFLGILGGAVHYFVASALLETGLLGRTIAIGAAVAYLLQYFVQILADSNLLLLILIIIGGITLIPIFKNSWQWIILECLPTEETVEKKTLSGKRNRLRTAIILSIAAVVLLSYCDSWLIHRMVETEFQAVSAYTWPRLFTILGYILVGATGDYGKGRFVNITLFVAVLWLIMCPVLLSDNDSIMLIMVIFYIAVGVYMGYMYFMFFTLSPYLGKRGILYASGGRIIEGTAGVLFSLLPWGGMKTWHIIAIGIMSVTVMAAAIVRDFVLAKESEKTMDVGEGADADDIGISLEIGGAENLDDTEIVYDPQSNRDNTDETVQDTPAATDVIEVAGAADSGAGEVVEATVNGIPESAEVTAQRFTEIEDDEESLKQILARIAEENHLTDREQEVFEKLIFTEDSRQEIADALFISRRVLQRHVAAIYEKTGTKSRVGLYRLYHKASMGD
ncbi:MAG: helix-turn-helix transcriptional regulator [Oribacterium sp.]|nr:helix-turn-helix transcriptional regulator [Oribacterium sp.]